MIKLGKSPCKRFVFVIDEHGRVLEKESLHKLISELFEKVLCEENIDADVSNGHDINICAGLAKQMSERNIADCEIIYLHGSKYPPVLLSNENKEMLIALLPEFSGTSAEAIFRILTDSDAFSAFSSE